MKTGGRKQFSLRSTNYNKIMFWWFYRHIIKTWEGWPNVLKFQFLSIFAIRCKRRQETVSIPKYSLKITNQDHYFWNSVDAKQVLANITFIAPCKGMRIPESVKFLLVESGIRKYSAQGIRNPTKDWNPESKGAIHSTKIQTGPTGKRRPPQKVDQFFRKFSGWTEPIHWVLDRNFRKFWLNGSRPKFY